MNWLKLAQDSPSLSNNKKEITISKIYCDKARQNDEICEELMYTHGSHDNRSFILNAFHQRTFSKSSTTVKDVNDAIDSLDVNKVYGNFFLIEPNLWYTSNKEMFGDFEGKVFHLVELQGFSEEELKEIKSHKKISVWVKAKYEKDLGVEPN